MILIKRTTARIGLSALSLSWVNGDPVTYTNWSPVEPNNPNSPEPGTWEFYVHIWQPGDFYAGRWNNLQNGTSSVFRFAALLRCAGTLQPQLRLRLRRRDGHPQCISGR